MTFFRTTLILAAFALTACTEKPQTVQAAVKKSDSKASDGAANPYVAAGWKAGDPESWEQQMRNRARGQDEYTRAASTTQ